MRRNVEGIALVTALAILAIVTLLVVGTVFTTQIESWTTRNDATSTQAYYIAHAGLEKYKTIAFQTYNFYLNHLQDYGDSLGTTAICGNLLASGLDLDRDFSFSSTNDLLPGGSITRNYGGGTYKITYAVSGPDIVLTSVGTIHKARATVQVVFHPQNAGLFSNALFAGGGISSQYINGDAQVYGSVYVEGDAANPTTVINSNGNFSMHNYYDSTEIANLFGNTFTTTQLKSMLGATATDQTDLCARLRVAYGSVATSGSVTLGAAQSTAPSSDYKASLAGLNVYQGSSDISQTGSSTIYADNYPNGDLSYDLSKNMPLPNLDTTPCKSDPSHSWRYCLDNGSQASSFPVDAALTTSGSCVLPMVGSTITFDTTTIDCTYTTTDAHGNTVQHGFKYSYDASTGSGTLTVHGVVDFKGYNLHFSKNVQTQYSGKATIMATTVNGDGGNVPVDGDVLPNTTQCVMVGGNCKTPSFPSDENDRGERPHLHR
ncbi:MAG: pilus assembly PilX N-terminal domain-containing protein [Deinococcales bacterium]